MIDAKQIEEWKAALGPLGAPRTVLTSAWMSAVEALLAEREEREERMRVILHAGPSTALAVSIYDRAAKAEEENKRLLAEREEMLAEITRLRKPPRQACGRCWKTDRQLFAVETAPARIDFLCAECKP